MKKNLLTLACLLLCLSITAQQDPKKEHFKFFNPNIEPLLPYEKAMVHADLDSLRFVFERRKLPIEGTTVMIELFSAQELWERYKKPISPLNIKDPSKCRKVRLKLANAPHYFSVEPLNFKSEK